MWREKHLGARDLQTFETGCQNASVCLQVAPLQSYCKTIADKRSTEGRSTAKDDLCMVNGWHVMQIKETIAFNNPGSDGQPVVDI